MDDAPREMERHNRMPLFFVVLFLGLVAWGLWYIAAYTPQISGWSQYDVLKKELEAERKKAQGTAPLRENPYESDPKAVAEGQLLYGENCAGCHGKDLSGDTGPDLTGHLASGETDDALFRNISDGFEGAMPGFGSSLGRDRIWKVVAYVDSVRERPGAR